MATRLKYTTEQLNYYRICYVVTDILTEGLRTIFKQEWDNRYKTTLGEWKDQPKNGMDFWNGESTRNRKRNAGLLTTMKNGDRAEWDCTMLFYAILYSDCIYSLNPSIRSNVDDLRKIRNEEFAHMRRGHLSNGDFQIVIAKVKTALHALGLPTLKINEVQNQTDFPTEKLNEVLRKVDDLKQEVNKKEKELLEKDKELLQKGTKLEEKLEELQEKGKELQRKEEQRLALEEQLHSDVSPFCILPPKPSHDIAPRESEVGEVLQNLQTLKDANDGLSILYLSGNPGSGKSQLARLAAKRFYDEVEQIPSAASFVMTLNAENSEALLKSYVFFARHCKCPGYEITNTYGSKDLNTDEKISYFKTLISTKIEHYASWLLVVDNVTSVSRTSDYLPDTGNELWARGQMLITTQDTASMPLSSSSIRNISLSAGMHPDDACFLLNLLTGTTDVEIIKETAKVLDYQPLALAGAATYVRQVRQNKATSKFGWTDYLKKLEMGKRSATENILAETNPSYSKSMTKAITLAVEKAMADDIILRRMFLFLSMCASQPILQEIIIEYIKAIDDKFEDDDMIRMRMNRCSLLLTEEVVSGVYIRVHGVVHDVIKSATKDCTTDENEQVVYGAVMSFSKFKDLESIVVGTRIVSHLKMLSINIEDTFFRKGIPEVSEKALNYYCYQSSGLWSLSEMCQDHSEFKAALIYSKLLLTMIDLTHVGTDQAKAECYNRLGVSLNKLDENDQAKNFYKRALEIQLKELGPEHVDVASTYANLGNLHRVLGDTDQAKEYYERALEIKLKELGPEHVDVASTYANLGNLHRVLGDTDQAKEYYERALEIKLKKLGPEHVHVTNTYNSLGNLLFSALGDTDQAKDYYKRALEIRLKKLGPEHVDVANTYNSLGSLHSALGDTDQGKDYFKRALEIQLKKLGPEHVHVANTYGNLGNLHSALRDTDQAKGHYERALEIQLKKLGPEHVHVASTYSNLGNLHIALGATDQAKDYYKRALEIRLKKLGPENVHVANTYNSLGSLHSGMGDTDQAKDYYERALEIRLKKLGPEHVHVANTYNSLGNLHSALGDTDQAKGYYKRALEIQLKKLGPEHVDVAHSYRNLSCIHNDLGEFEEAKHCRDCALVIYISKYGQEHTRTLEVRRNISWLQQKRKRVDDPGAVLKKKKRDSF